MIDPKSAIKTMSLDSIKRWKLLGSLFPAKIFIPNLPQFQFIKAVGNCIESDKRLFLMRSGNGVGKTSVVCNVLLNLIYGFDKVNIYRDITDKESGEKISGFFDFPLYRSFPKNWPRQIWYISNRDSLNTIHAEIKKWAPKPINGVHFFRESNEGKGYKSKILFTPYGRPGFELHYKTTDQDLKTFESANVSIIVADEPPSEQIFRACISRLRQGGIILMPATPLWDAGWLQDAIIECNDHQHWQQQVSVWGNCVETAGHWHIKGFGCHPKGNLFKKDIDFQIKNYDEDERKARIDGSMLNMSGLIIKNYDRDNTFKPVDLVKAHPRLYNYRFVLDPHDRKLPFACWLRMNHRGKIEVIREWPSLDDVQSKNKFYHQIKNHGDLSIQDYVKIFLDIEKNELKIPIDRIEDIIDPNFGLKTSSVTGQRIYEMYQDESEKYHREYAFFTSVDDDLKSGHTAIRNALSNVDENGNHKFIVSTTCKNIDIAFRRYSWLDGPPKSYERHGLSERIQQRYKDPIDVIRYGLMLEWDYTSLQKKESFNRPEGSLAV